MLNHCPAIEPTTTTSRATKSRLTPNFWPFGSDPLTSGPMNRPAASHAVAIHKHAELYMPGPSHAVRQPLREREAVETIALDPVMSGDDAQQDLHEDHGRHDPEILDCRLLGRRGLPANNRVGFGDRLGGAFLRLRGVPPDHRSDPGEQHDDAYAGPDHGLAGGAIADQRLMRPVARVGKVGSGTVGGRRP